MEYQPGMEQIGSEIQDAVISKMNECDFDSYTAADVRRALQKDVLSTGIYFLFRRSRKAWTTEITHSITRSAAVT